MRLTLVLLLVAAIPIAADQKSKKEEPQPLPIFVTSVGAANGLTDANKDNLDAVADISKALKRDKAFSLVTSADHAKLHLTVTGRERGQLTGFGIEHFVKASLRYGKTQMALSGMANGGTAMSNGAWSNAAAKVATQVGEWHSEFCGSPRHSIGASSAWKKTGGSSLKAMAILIRHLGGIAAPRLTLVATELPSAGRQIVG